MTSPKVGIPIEEIAILLNERDEARELAKRMYQALIQFPSPKGISDLVDNWPEEEPIWLWRTP